MSLQFKAGWDDEKKNYVTKYGPYEAFLKSFDQGAVTKAILAATGSFSPLAQQMLTDAKNTGGSVVTIEQGTHQAEDTSGGGFKLHFTLRHNGKAFHCYVGQKNSGELYVTQITP